MRILFLGNNWAAVQVLEWLRVQGEEVVGLVAHPEGGRKFGRELIEKSGLASDKVFDGSRLQEPEILKRIEELRAEIGVSVFFGHLLKSEFLKMFPRGVINLHPSFLPFNRGAYPNVWPIIEHTPAGVSLHYIDEGVDTGDIIAQREIGVALTDTAETLYRKLEQACVELFCETWPAIKSGKAPRLPQPGNAGTFHRVKDAAGIDRIDPEKMYRAQDLIDLIRARTFPPYKGAYLDVNGKKIYLRLQLEEEQ
jgi:methionyl-tRNA formyltransferase